MKIFAMAKTNPFKFGTVVDGVYFTNRKNELSAIKETLHSPNHLILISPRRFGKASLVNKAIDGQNRKTIFLDIQLTNSIEDFAARYLKRIYAIYPRERIRSFIKKFRIIPNISLNPVSNDDEISFQPNIAQQPLVEDVLNLLEKLSSPKQRAIVVFDEFQEINKVGKGLDRILRSVMQNHKNINYIFLGSQESMMREIFEKKKSPFYHFGQLMYLQKIERRLFTAFITERITDLCFRPDLIANQILGFTQGHPYYTQQLAYLTWNLLNQQQDQEIVVQNAIEETILIHDLDYERLWLTFNSTDRKIFTGLTIEKLSPLSADAANMMNIKATSTVFSSLKRLMQNGYIIKTGGIYEIDDPFFREWIIMRRKGI